MLPGTGGAEHRDRLAAWRNRSPGRDAWRQRSCEREILPPARSAGAGLHAAGETGRAERGSLGAPPVAGLWTPLAAAPVSPTVNHRRPLLSAEMVPQRAIGRAAGHLVA